MRERAVKPPELARAIGTTERATYAYTKGQYVPGIDIAQRMADALNAPILVELARNDKRRKCQTCQRSFFVEKGPRKFCTESCRRVATKGGRRVLPDPRQDAIRAMCLGCEPEGVCRHDGCPLRPFSPLPFGEAMRVEPIGDPRVAERRAIWRERWQRRRDRGAA
jgi:DNA-binding XRE family transcriptional regulator